MGGKMHWRTRLQILFQFLVLLLFVACVGGAVWGFLSLLFGSDDLPILQGELSGSHDDLTTRIGLAMEAAGNRTLGFSSIKFINMPKRFDRADAATIQAYLSGIDLEYYPAVEPVQVGGVGMPPSSNPAALRVGEKGCWRAHANIWAEMLRKNSPPVLILESDSAWDVNIRPVMALLSKKLGRFLQESNSQPLYHNRSTNQTHPQRHEIQPFPDDPWYSAHWDIISLGPCYDELKSQTPYLRYNDPFAPPLDTSNLSTSHHPHEGIKGERILYRSGGPICTTAYAITTRGAAKLLTRTAMNLNAPLDMIIRHMVENDELVVYGTVPTVMAQWDYVEGIGMDGKGSDIYRGEGDKGAFADGNNNDTMDMPGWEKVMQTNSVWTVKSGQPHASFKEMALQVARERIFSDERDIEAHWEMSDLE